MKSLLITLAVFLLLAQFASGSWYVKKCSNKSGNCRKKCKTGETATDPPSSKCPKSKKCCVIINIDHVIGSCDKMKFPTPKGGPDRIRGAGTHMPMGGTEEPTDIDNVTSGAAGGPGARPAAGTAAAGGTSAAAATTTS